MVRFSTILFCALIISVAACVDAEDTKPKEPKGLDVVPDTAVTVIQKTNAFFQGNLEITMSGDKDKNKNKNNYSVNAIGQKVPKLTGVK
jgi:hypothetical protein